MENNKKIDILIIEDDPAHSSLIREAILESSVTENIHIMDDGAEAIDLLLSQGNYSNRRGIGYPKLVILDLNLPKVSGLEVLERLKKNEDTRHIPVVIMTVSQNVLNYERAQELGANSYIIKPVNSFKFINIVKDLGAFWMEKD